MLRENGGEEEIKEKTSQYLVDDSDSKFYAIDSIRYTAQKQSKAKHSKAKQSKAKKTYVQRKTVLFPEPHWPQTL
jgi:hypothetical protein